MSIYTAVSTALTIPDARDLIRDDQGSHLIAISLTTVPTSWATGDCLLDSVISFDDLSDDWAPATDPSYGDRLFYLVCNADSAVPDDKNEAEKRRVNWANFSLLGQDGEEETTAWNLSDDPPLPDHLDQILDNCFWGIEDVEEEERVRGRERIEQTEIGGKFVLREGLIDLLLHLLCNSGIDGHIPPALDARDQVQQGNEERVGLKGAILEAPNIMISPFGKRRVARVASCGRDVSFT
eukprot:scaffold17336_cov172-Skeletonema_dohrnii-CCMP3373.AAC.3